MKQYLLTLSLLVAVVFTHAQDSVPLFQSKDALELRLTGSIKSIKKNSDDSTLVTGKFEYKNSPDSWLTVPVQARVRGNFRLKNCYFPPLKIKFSKKDVVGTVFEGNKSLKLVMPCKTSKDKNELIRKEYLCYQFYQVLSPYHFRTRLANMSLTEISQKKPHNYDLLTFFVEDNSMVAKRSDGKIIESKGLSPAAFDEKQAIRNDYSQYMIGNADWSAVYQHNSNILYADGKYIALAYDFDMSGFVNAGYAHDMPPQLGTGDPRERVYRGFCKSQEAMEEIRKEFLDKENTIQLLIDEQAAYFDEYNMKDMHRYIDDFFDILRDDYRFKVNIVEGCRTK